MKHQRRRTTQLNSHSPGLWVLNIRINICSISWDLGEGKSSYDSYIRDYLYLQRSAHLKGKSYNTFELCHHSTASGTSISNDGVGVTHCTGGKSTESKGLGKYVLGEVLSLNYTDNENVITVRTPLVDVVKAGSEHSLVQGELCITFTWNNHLFLAS